MAIRTMAAIAMLGRLRVPDVASSLPRVAPGLAALPGVGRAAAAAEALANVLPGGMLAAAAPAFVTTGPLSTRRIAASDPLAPVPARTSVANGAGSCSASRSLEKRRPVSAL